MTDQQRAERIEFIKKLLEANEFYPIQELGRRKFTNLTYMKDVGFNNYLVSFRGAFIMFGYDDKYEEISYDQPLKPLREFIKISNQK